MSDGVPGIEGLDITGWPEGQVMDPNAIAALQYLQDQVAENQGLFSDILNQLADQIESGLSDQSGGLFKIARTLSARARSWLSQQGKLFEPILADLLEPAVQTVAENGVMLATLPGEAEPSVVQFEQPVTPQELNPDDPCQLPMMLRFPRLEGFPAGEPYPGDGAWWVGWTVPRLVTPTEFEQYWLQIDRPQPDAVPLYLIPQFAEAFGQTGNQGRPRAWSSVTLWKPDPGITGLAMGWVWQESLLETGTGRLPNQEEGYYWQLLWPGEACQPIPSGPGLVPLPIPPVIPGPAPVEPEPPEEPQPEGQVEVAGEQAGPGPRECCPFPTELGLAFWAEPVADGYRHRALKWLGLNGGQPAESLTALVDELDAEVDEFLGLADSTGILAWAQQREAFADVQE